MSWELSFTTALHLVEDEAGLFVHAKFAAGDSEVGLDGYFDPGATYCVLPRWAAEKMGLDIESGTPVTLRTGGGPLPTHQHYVHLTLGDLCFEDVPVCIPKYPEFHRGLLGRAGWFPKVDLGVVVYDERLYLRFHQ
jgi:predicted aspartyl protease